MKLFYEHEWAYMQKRGMDLVDNARSIGPDFMIHVSSRVVNVSLQREAKFLCGPDVYRHKHNDKEYYAWRRWPEHQDNDTPTATTLHSL